MNHLKHEKSPYLLQHAENPVNWYPWCEEAFDLAAEKDLEIIRMPKLHSFVTFTEPVLADPWGWNRCLAYRLEIPRSGGYSRRDDT